MLLPDVLCRLSCGGEHLIRAAQPILRDADAAGEAQRAARHGNADRFTPRDERELLGQLGCGDHAGSFQSGGYFKPRASIASSMSLSESGISPRTTLMNLSST